MSSAGPDSLTGVTTVALSLMHHVSQNEPGLIKNRVYWLTLYSQCLMATRGAAPQEIAAAIESNSSKSSTAAKGADKQP